MAHNTLVNMVILLRIWSGGATTVHTVYFSFTETHLSTVTSHTEALKLAGTTLKQKDEIDKQIWLCQKDEKIRNWRPTQTAGCNAIPWCSCSLQACSLWGRLHFKLIRKRFFSCKNAIICCCLLNGNYMKICGQVSWSSIFLKMWSSVKWNEMNNYRESSLNCTVALYDPNAAAARMICVLVPLRLVVGGSVVSRGPVGAAGFT